WSSTDELSDVLRRSSDALREISQASVNSKIPDALDAAKRLASRWKSMPVPNRREFLRQFIKSVVIRENSVEVGFWPMRLQQALLEDSVDFGADIQRALTSQQSNSNGGIFVLEISATLKRHRKKVRLLLPTEYSDGTPTHGPIPSLVKAVVRAHEWYG